MENHSFLQGGGEMGERTRCFDWAQTSIGAPGTWPQSLRTTVSNLLRSKFPMFLWWGDDMIQFYNDAYRPSMGANGKHPHALGQKGEDCWPEIWDIISPLHEQVRTTGEATWSENQLVPIFRNGRIEDVYWTFSYSSVLTDNGQHGGILVTCMETTAEVLGQKKLKASQDSLQFALKAGHLGAWELNLKTFTLQASDNCKQNFGQPLDRPFAYATLRNSIHPDDRKYQEEAVLKTIETGTDYDVEYRVIWPDGTLHWVNVRGQLHLNAAGTPESLVGVSIDITDRKRAEQKLLESETRFRHMVERAPVAITLTRGADMVIESINAPMLQIMDKQNKEDVLGKRLIDVLPEVEGQAVLGVVRNVLETGETFRGTEVPVDLLTDGVMQTRFFNLSYTPVVEADKTTSVLHVAFDVTAHVAARKKIEESEGRFRLLADASPILIWMLKPDGSYNYVNTTTLDFLGITQEQIAEVGWGPFLHPDDTGPASEAVANAVENQQRYEMEHRLFHRDGVYRWVYSQAIPVYDASGKVFAYVGSSIDIDEAKKSREKLQTALEQARLSKEAAELGTFDMDLEKGTMHWDERCRTLFGISHHGPVAYEKEFVEGLHPDDRERVTKLIENLFVKSISNGDYDVEYRTIGAEDGVLRWVRAKGKVYFDANDKPYRFIGSVLDITEKVLAIQKIEGLVEARTKELAQVNASLLQANKELQRSNANLEEFAHAASHDLKEPIRKIHFFTNKLKDQLGGHTNESETRSFSRIENATRRMGNLIDDLLLYSHVSQRPHEKESVDLNEKVQQALEDLDLDIEEKGAVVKVGTLPVVKGYRRQLQQLFQNLISNAVKYSKDDVPPVIRITAEETTVNGQRYHLISVADNGIGFAQEYEAKIFQMFSRLHGRNEYSGTGVGLSIVKKVVENHEGFIQVKSKPGLGATFAIYLPV